MGPSRLADGPHPLILDASSAINLLASGRAVEVLGALGRQVVMTSQAEGEVGRDPLTGTPGSLALQRLVSVGVLRTASLSDSAYELFLDLVSAPSPDGLDDGEASTIAYAAEIQGIPILDERKATRIAPKFCSLSPICTIDLFACSQVDNALGAVGVGDAVHSALIRGRMRVPELFRSWLLDRLSPDRLRVCPSIPRSWLQSPAAPAAARGRG